MAWYKLSDLAAELRALGRCGTGDAEVVHFLDGEHGAQFLPMLLRPRARRAGGVRARRRSLGSWRPRSGARAPWRRSTSRPTCSTSA
jgi:hypothetical protein